MQIAAKVHSRDVTKVPAYLNTLIFCFSDIFASSASSSKKSPTKKKEESKKKPPTSNPSDDSNIFDDPLNVFGGD